MQEAPGYDSLSDRLQMAVMQAGLFPDDDSSESEASEASGDDGWTSDEDEEGEGEEADWEGASGYEVINSLLYIKYI